MTTMRLPYALLCLALVHCRGPEIAHRPAPGGPSLSVATPSAAPPQAPAPVVADGGVALPAVPEPPSEPPYDLAQDLTSREDKARAELGTSVSLRRVGMFLVIGPKELAAGSFGTSVRFVERITQALMNQRFAKEPARAVSVYLFPEARTYGAYCQKFTGGPPISVYGFYRPDLRALIMNLGPGLGTLSHELVHPYVEADFPGAPIWLNEGIASLYEAPVLPKAGEIHGIKNWRLPALQQGLRARPQVFKASALFALSDESFRGDDESVHYAQARYLCQWLDERGLLWPFYQAFRDNHATDPTGEKSFERVVGKAPAAIDPVFARWVQAL